VRRVHDRFATFRVSVRKAAPRSPHAKSLSPLATQQRPHSPERQLLYVPDGCTHVAGETANWYSSARRVS
jgi:hypothetical protein